MTRNITHFSQILVFLFVILLQTGNAAAEDQAGLSELSPAQELLRKMTQANRELTYKGRFSYEYGGAMSTMEVLHTMQNGQVIEKLSHLSGEKRELLRQSNNDACNKPADHLLTGMSLGTTGEEILFSDFYSVVLKGKGRIAGRTVNVLHLVPKDNFRYGYVLSLDEESGLLLQSMVIGSKQQVLERFQFIAIEIGLQLDESDLTPSEQIHHQITDDASPCLQESSNLQTRWQANWLPGGFVLADYQGHENLQNETLVYTDGLAVFSVFIDSGQPGLRDLSGKRGSTVIYLFNKQIDETLYTICVVGEVPSSTAKRVAQSMQYQAATE